jgi:SnoaL-like domain
MRTDRELLIEIYANFNARKMDAVLETFHENVDWPNGMEGGRVHGRNAVRDYWTRQWGMLNPHVEPISFMTDESGRTVVTVHQVVHDLEGKLLVDQLVLHAYRIEDGLIKSMEIQAVR